MKKLTILICTLLFSALSFSQSFVEKEFHEMLPDLGGDVIIKKIQYDIVGEKAFSSFYIDVPEPGNYYLYLWLCPTRLADGTFSVYDVLVNDTPVGRIKPTVSDWQSISLDTGKKICLSEGASRISIVGEIPDIPNVEFVRLSTDAGKAEISEGNYREYKTNVLENSRLQVEDNERLYAEGLDSISRQKTRRVVSFPLAPQTNPPYDADYRIGHTINYTFYKKVYFQQGQAVTISSTGINHFNHVLELFHISSPSTYSWASLSGSGNASISVTIPETSFYYVRVRSFMNNQSGLCNLNINNSTYNDSVTVYSYGIRGEKDTQNVYNSFTCYRSGVPRIWVEEGSIPGKIRAYNDDYTSSTSDYSWGYYSRVKRQYESTLNAILFSTYGSYQPTGTCDIYCNCLNVYTNISDNFIQSARGSYDYRCISWAGGIYTDYIWPPHVFTGFGQSDLDAFDYFYGMERYPGCSVFTRSGATEDNSTIDLWATTNDSIEYQHASVRKGADNNAHGFDWESKCGALTRIYHPRNHVPFTSYGQVVEHYRRVDTGTTGITLEESIANGWAVLENVHFTKNESDYINTQIKKLSGDTLSWFDAMYGKWQEVWNTTCYSNPDVIADCDEYRELLSFCQKTEPLKYTVYKKLDEGNVSAICLIKDLVLKENRGLLKRVFDNNKKQKYTDSGAQIVRTMQSNAMLFLKELLKEEVETFKARLDDGAETGISYSNSDDYSVRQAASSVFLSFSIGNTARVYADILSLQGDIITKLVDDQFLQPSTYMFQSNMPKGIYLIRYIKDGTVNVKKVRVE